MDKYVVELTSEEPRELNGLVSKGKTAARRITHARVLLRSDESQGGPAWTDKQISEAFGIHSNTIHRIRRQFVEQGLQASLERKSRTVLPANGLLTAKLRRICLPCVVASRRKERINGTCDCWQTNWSSWGLC
ncbi:MAG TPA: helix-turn-helix domain-containing protein [Sedimentisphaerales bacterium]|nr:helix-turn-helix domain-containing protein [Sedimentisphaerales bacterium]